MLETAKKKYEEALKALHDSSLNRDSVEKTIRGYKAVKNLTERQINACTELMYNIRDLNLVTPDLLGYTVAPYRVRGDDTVTNVAVIKDTMTIAIELFTIYNKLQEEETSLKDDIQDEEYIEQL